MQKTIGIPISLKAEAYRRHRARYEITGRTMWQAKLQEQNVYGYIVVKITPNDISNCDNR